jgi:hypothetical protein
MPETVEMPIHDWTRVNAGTFHDFHQSWAIEVRNALNFGCLPDGYFAMAEQVVSGPIPHVVTLQQHDNLSEPTGGVALAAAPPQASYVATAEQDVYAARGNRIAIKHRLGKVVAVIEIISPGNKHSEGAFRSLIEKACELIGSGINLLVIDLFPPGKHDRLGIHRAIWERIDQDSFELPPDKPLTIAAYKALGIRTAYVEPIAVGDPLPSLPIFLDAETYVPAPLEASYQAAWDTCPSIVKALVE